MITLSFDANKLDKARYKKVPGKDGKPDALYVDLVLYETPDSQYGDFIVKQQVTKEEREKKVSLPILGNGKRWDKGSGGRSQAPAAQPHPEEQYNPPF
jgi:hypothetical protein